MKKFEKKSKIRLALLAGAAVFATGAAAGGAVARAETFDPSLHGLVLFELEDDWAYESDDDDSEVNTVTATVEPYFILSLTEGFAIETQMVFEQVEDPDAGEDTEFDNQGLYVETLLASYTT